MFTLEFAHARFTFDIYEEEFYKNKFDRYLVELDPKAFMIKQVDELKLNSKEENIFSGPTFDLFQGDNYQLQLQKNDEGKYVGMFYLYNDHASFFASPNEGEELTYVLLEYIVTYYIMQNNVAILMHGSSILYNEKGYIFTAPSGTGKSTHTQIWVKLGLAKHINDDKNLLLLEDDKLVLYGNPWSGKHNRGDNIFSTLNAVIFLHQDKTNNIKKMGLKETLIKLMPQVVRPITKKEKSNWNTITDKILTLPCFSLGCTISKEAVDIVKNELDKQI